MQIGDTGNTASVVVLPSVAAVIAGGDATPALNAQCFLTVWMTQTGVTPGSGGRCRSRRRWMQTAWLSRANIAGQPEPQNIWIAGWLPKSNVIAITDPSGQVATAYSSILRGQQAPTWLKGNAADYLFLGAMGTASLPGAGGAGNQLYVQPADNANNRIPPALACVFDTANTSTATATDPESGQPTNTTTIPILLLVVYREQYMQLLNWGRRGASSSRIPSRSPRPPGRARSFPWASSMRMLADRVRGDLGADLRRPGEQSADLHLSVFRPEPLVRLGVARLVVLVEGCRSVTTAATAG